MFFDDTKSTMISVEMHDGFQLDDYQRIQDAFRAGVDHLLSTLDLQSRFKIDCNQIALDIQSKRAGKDLGAKRFSHWLTQRGITVDEIITFGDSLSDIAMADELTCVTPSAKRTQVSFVYVGPNGTSQFGERSFEVIDQGEYSLGTLRFLKRLL